MMVVVALAVSHLRTSHRLGTTISENTQLRNELGRLSVDDGSKLYLMSIPTTQENLWRWRIHMPTESNFRLGITDAGVIPVPGSPKTPGSNTAYFDDPIPPGESVVEAKLYRDGAGVWTVSVRTSDGMMTCALRHGNLWWLDEGVFFKTHSGSRESTAIDATKTIPLLRHVLIQHESLVPAQTKRGIMIWLEPAT